MSAGGSPMNRNSRFAQGIIAAGFLLLGTTGLCCGTPRKFELRGELLPANRAVDARIQVDLEGTTRQFSASTFASGSRFRFRNLEAGTYRARVIVYILGWQTTPARVAPSQSGGAGALGVGSSQPAGSVSTGKGGEGPAHVRTTAVEQATWTTAAVDLRIWVQTVVVSPATADDKQVVQQRFVFGQTLKEIPPPATPVAVSVQELSIPDRARLEYQKAMQATRGRTPNYQSAERHLENAVAICPNYVSAISALGSACYHKKEYQKAESYCRKALSITPDWYESLAVLGAIFNDLGRFQEALAFNEKAVKRMPGDAAANEQMARALMGLRRDQEALPYLQAVEEIDPYHASEPQLLLAGVHARQGDRQKAAAKLQEYARLRPETALAAEVRNSLHQLIDTLAQKR
jgi:Flp pilus assembly protein TadD